MLLVSAECHFRNISRFDSNFMVTQTQVKFGKNCSPMKLINNWNGVFVLDCILIQGPVVDT
jgi:hypothetical protein